MSKPTKSRQGDSVVAYSEKETLPMWTPNSIIRNRTNGTAVLVIHVYRNCTIIVELNDNAPIVQPKAILEREYANWARESEMENDDAIQYEKDWHYKPVFMKG